MTLDDPFPPPPPGFLPLPPQNPETGGGGRPGTDGRRPGAPGRFRERLVEASPELLRIARYHGLSGSEAEDVVQAALVTGLERRAAFDPARRLRPWLVGILLKKIAEARRAGQRSGRTPESSRPAPQTPLSAAEAEEVERLVHAALGDLPAGYRDVLVPYLRDEKSGGQIASEMCRAPGTVRSQIHRGLKLLRERLPSSLALGGLAGLFLGRRARAPASPAPPTPDGEKLATGSALLPRAALVIGGLGAAGWVLVATTERSSAIPTGVDRSASLRSAPLAVGSADTRGASGDVAGSPSVAAAEPTKRRLDAAAVDGSTEAPDATLPVATFPIRAIDRRTGEPAAGLELEVFHALEGDDGVLTRHRLDETGELQLPLDVGRLAFLSVGVDQPGFEPFSTTWERSRKPPISHLSLPLNPARPIGGVLVDHGGEPVAGARIYLKGREIGGARNGSRVYEDAGVSDARGHWRIERAPADAPCFYLRVVHPERATQLGYRERVLSSGSLYAFEGRIVLPAPGELQELFVQDERGQPLAGASVELYPDGTGFFYGESLATDATGRVRYAPPDRPYRLLVAAEGLTPHARRVASGLDPTTTITLVPPVSTELRFVDERGDALADLRIEVLASKTQRLLCPDAGGRVRLARAPGSPTFLALRRPDALGHVFTLIEGNVTSKQVVVPDPCLLTARVAIEEGEGERVDAFRLNVRCEAQRFLGSRAFGARGRTTTVELALLEPCVPRCATITVEASAGVGTRWESEPLALAPEIHCAPELVPGPLLRLRVLGPDGRPLEYGKVFVIGTGDTMVFRNGKLLTSGSFTYAESDGVARVPRPDGPFHVAAESRQGFRFLRDGGLPPDGVVRVLPWSEIEGTVPRPAEVTEIRLTNRDERKGQPPGTTFLMKGATQPTTEGHFRFHAVPAGPLEVVVAREDGSEQRIPVVVEPGKRIPVAFP